MRILSAGSALLVGFALLTTGCVIGDGKYKRPRELDDGWKIDKLRLLGVRATPAEARPGETVRFESLLVDPEESVEMVLWLACAWTDSDSDGCTVDLSSLDLDDPTPEDLEAAGVIALGSYGRLERLP